MQGSWPVLLQYDKPRDTPFAVRLTVNCRRSGQTPERLEFMPLMSARVPAILIRPRSTPFLQGALPHFRN